MSGFEDHGVPKEEVLQPLENTQELEEQDRLLIQEGIRGNFLMRHLLNEENANMLKEMISHFAVRSVAAGEIVIKQGTKGDFFYVCESGRYDVIVDGVKVHTYEVDQAARSFPTFGELALMYSKPRAASVVATEAGRLFQLGRSSFKMALAAKAVAADVTKSLRKVGIFSSLRFDQLQGLRDLMIEKTFAPGETIISRGEYGSMFYVVVKGFARVMPEDGVAALTTLDNRLALQPVHSEVTLESSTYFGEHALFHGTAHTADVVAGDGIDEAPGDSVSQEGGLREASRARCNSFSTTRSIDGKRSQSNMRRSSRIMTWLKLAVALSTLPTSSLPWLVVSSTLPVTR